MYCSLESGGLVTASTTEYDTSDGLYDLHSYNACLGALSLLHQTDDPELVMLSPCHGKRSSTGAPLTHPTSGTRCLN